MVVRQRKKKAIQKKEKHIMRRNPRTRARIVPAKRVVAARGVKASSVPVPSIAGRKRLLPLRSHASARGATQQVDDMLRQRYPVVTSPFPVPSAPLPWKPEWGPFFAISIRPYRFQQMVDRVKPWPVTLFQGTYGFPSNVPTSTPTPTPTLQSALRPARARIRVLHRQLNAGQAGCYDSHLRLWKHIVDSNIQCAIIAEDDAAVFYSQEHYDTISQAMTDIKAMKQPWDVLYIAFNMCGGPGAHVYGSIYRSRMCQGLFFYAISLQGAKKLYNAAYARRYLAIDVLLQELAQQRAIESFCMKKRMCYVVPVHSDTSVLI